MGNGTNRLLRTLAWAAVGYGAGAIAGYWLVTIGSGNPHDRTLEASMTAAFVLGPLGAVIGGVWGALTRRPPGPGG